MKVLEILKTFKYSAVVKNDYLHPEKLSSFYATESNVFILTKLLSQIVKGSNKAIIVSGAYGTGKSFLVSLIVGLLSGTIKGSNYRLLLKKMTACGADEKEINALIASKYVVVFPHDVFHSFSQALLVGIDSAINQYGLNIILDSSYQAILGKIDRWEASHRGFYDALVKKLSEKNTNIADFRREIEAYSPKAYQLFEKIYPEFMGGEKFIPIESINSVQDLLKSFEKQVQKSGYAGVIYIFDEFGRYLENNIDRLDVKEIQDVAEYCNSDVKSSFILITHKDIFQYSKRVRIKAERDEWEKVAGRFSRTHLMYEASNTLSMISSVLQKNETAFSQLLNKNAAFFEDLLKKMSDLNIPAPEKKLHDFFPMSYVAAEMLPKLSQKLAQNERTLFAFLCGEDATCLPQIYKQSIVAPGMITLDSLYDFFEDNFKFLDLDSKEYQTYLSVREILSSITEQQEIRLLKAVAIFHIVNEFSEYPPTQRLLELALCLKSEEFQAVSEALLHRGVLVYRKHLGMFSIVHDQDINIDKEIRAQIDKIQDFDAVDLLSTSLPLGVEYPVKYNDYFKMTRYLERIYWSISSDPNILEKKQFSNNDGLIAYVIDGDADLNEKPLIALSECFESVVFVVPKDSLNLKEELVQLEAIKQLPLVNSKIQASSIAQKELYQYKIEFLEYADQLISQAFSAQEGFYIYLNGQRFSIESLTMYQDFLDTFLRKKYSKFTKNLIINYELINKTQLTSQIKKCRKTILDNLFKQIIEPYYFEKTGAENSIARIVLKNTGLWRNGLISFKGTKFENLYNEIMDDLHNSSQPYSFYLDKYVYGKSNYGMRLGIFSFIFGIILSVKRESVCISLDNTEVVLSSEIVDLLEANPERYILSMVEPAPDEADALTNLVQNPVLLPFYSASANLALAAFNAFRTYVLSLPRCIIPKVLEEAPHISKLLEGLSVSNSKNFFYGRLPQVYKMETLYECINLFGQDIDRIDFALQRLQAQLVISVLRSIGKSENSDLVKALRDWIAQLDDTQRNNLENSSLSIIATLQDDVDRDSILRTLTSAMNGGIDYYYWKTDEPVYDFAAKISTEFEKIISGDKSLSMFNDIPPAELSPLAIVLKDKLKAIVKGFGRSITEQEIKNAIIQLIRELN